MLKNLMMFPIQIKVNVVEHITIIAGVVEFQAAGVVVLAHNSGGPKMDIVQVCCFLSLYYLINSDVPDPNAGSGIIWPLLTEIWIRPDLNLTKRSGSGS